MNCTKAQKSSLLSESGQRNMEMDQDKERLQPDWWLGWANKEAQKVICQFYLHGCLPVWGLKGECPWHPGVIGLDLQLGHGVHWSPFGHHQIRQLGRVGFCFLKPEKSLGWVSMGVDAIKYQRVWLVNKMFNLPGGQINDLSSGKHYSLLFLPATPHLCLIPL